MKYFSINEEERKRIIGLHRKGVKPLSEQENIGDSNSDFGNDSSNSEGFLTIELELPQELCDFLKEQGIEDVSECKDIFADYAIYSVGSHYDGFLDEFGAWWGDNSDSYI